MMRVPLIDLTEQNHTLESALRSAFERVLHSGQFILSAEVAEFEKAVAALANVPHAIGVSSGTDAILLALMALGIGPGDEVICPSFTFFATAGSIARAGAEPVFADSQDADLNLDPSDVARRITPKTKAIIPVHLFGQSADMAPILELARQHRLAVIEDAAQSFGGTYAGQPVGGWGDCGCFSFFPTKNLGGFGDGGMLVCRDRGLAEKARILRNHGAQARYLHKHIGGNFRLDSLQAALLRVKLPYCAEYNARRQANAQHYSERLGRLKAAQDSGEPGLRLILPKPAPGRGHIWNQYTVRVQNSSSANRPNPRDALREFLSERGIGTEVYYPVPLHQQECFAGRGGDPPAADLPRATALARECLSLPIFPELKPAQLDEVIDAVAQFEKSH